MMTTADRGVKREGDEETERRRGEETKRQRSSVLRFLGSSARTICVKWLAAIICALALALPARAHEGPPFPILVDQHVGTMLVSLWGDPDIGTGTFFVILEPQDGQELPENVQVRIGVAPQSGRLEEAVYTAEPQDVRYGARYYSEVQFDQGEWWDVRLFIESPAATGVLTSEVEATPDGVLGPMSILLYMAPFLIIGFIWVKAILRKRSIRAAERPHA